MMQNCRVCPLSISLMPFLKELSRRTLVRCVFRRRLLPLMIYLSRGTIAHPDDVPTLNVAPGHCRCAPPPVDRFWCSSVSSAPLFQVVAPAPPGKVSLQYPPLHLRYLVVAPAPPPILPLVTTQGLDRQGSRGRTAKTSRPSRPTMTILCRSLAPR